jgi:hypothetical protein
MILVAGGDSFIHGNELSDWDIRSTQDSKLTFAALLARDFGFDYVSCARPGNANDAILRMTINKCEQVRNDGKDCVVIVGWTFVPRFEFPFEFNTDSPDTPFATISIYNETNRPLVKDFAKHFFRNVNSDWFPHFNTVKSIVLLQQYLKFNNIPFIFTATDNVVFSYTNDELLKPYWRMVDFDNWYMFPAAEEPWNTTSPRGFYQWAVENKYEIGPYQHPLDRAHADAAQLMKDKFNELVKKLVV